MEQTIIHTERNVDKFYRLPYEIIRNGKVYRLTDSTKPVPEYGWDGDYMVSGTYTLLSGAEQARWDAEAIASLKKEEQEAQKNAAYGRGLRHWKAEHFAGLVRTYCKPNEKINLDMSPITLSDGQQSSDVYVGATNAGEPVYWETVGAERYLWSAQAVVDRWITAWWDRWVTESGSVAATGVLRHIEEYRDGGVYGTDMYRRLVEIVGIDQLAEMARQQPLRVDGINRNYHGAKQGKSFTRFALYEELAAKYGLELVEMTRTGGISDWGTRMTDREKELRQQLRHRFEERHVDSAGIYADPNGVEFLLIDKAWVLLSDALKMPQIFPTWTSKDRDAVAEILGLNTFNVGSMWIGTYADGRRVLKQGRVGEEIMIPIDHIAANQIEEMNATQRERYQREKNAADWKPVYEYVRKHVAEFEEHRIVSVAVKEIKEGEYHGRRYGSVAKLRWYGFTIAQPGGGGIQFHCWRLDYVFGGMGEDGEAESGTMFFQEESEARKEFRQLIAK